MTDTVRLGFNVDHFATLRNARGGEHPDPLRACLLAIEAGANGITAHLREDRRHIRDADIQAIKAAISVPLNFEMAATDTMIDIAERIRPAACCLVPERREEVTTEGGLDVVGKGGEALASKIARIKSFGARVSLFIDPRPEALEASAQLGADIVELHTGELAHAFDAAADGPTDPGVRQELKRLRDATALGQRLGLEIHGGHGLNFETAQMVAAIPGIVELNIGHFIVGEAAFRGLEAVIAQMKAAIAQGQAEGKA